MLPRPSTVRAVRALQSSLRQASTTAPRTQLAHTVLSGRFIFRSTQNLSVPHIFRSFHLSSAYGKGISPETSDPQPKSCPKAEHVAEPASISTEEYHEIADSYIEDLVSKLEQLQEEREDVDCEYSAGVLNVSFPPAGTYVLNKQPPNKQIWLSSPTSGPKRFDYVVSGESMHEKEGCGSGDWVYLRDGTTLSELLRKELGVDVTVDHNAPQ